VSLVVCTKCKDKGPVLREECKRCGGKKYHKRMKVKYVYENLETGGLEYIAEKI
jgi:DnaJ-class molecular chaperone